MCIRDRYQRRVHGNIQRRYRSKIKGQRLREAIRGEQATTALLLQVVSAVIHLVVHTTPQGQGGIYLCPKRVGVGHIRDFHSATCYRHLRIAVGGVKGNRTAHDTHTLADGSANEPHIEAIFAHIVGAEDIVAHKAFARQPILITLHPGYFGTCKKHPRRILILHPQRGTFTPTGGIADIPPAYVPVAARNGIGVEQTFVGQVFTNGAGGVELNAFAQIPSKGDPCTLR
eukprot:TRINITY_DN20613_c0_g2_i2.p3 TRINITY_DN20613_c0_g2~~TRINITY_DN20613_c0_g2_i2.p3  ORF type:complete len:229 (+),score=-6.28 TRINITY_DN20613_c0_g2_i2:151-837(+)